jgi:hypothetical protein
VTDRPTETVYIRIPGALSEDLAQWIEDTGMPKVDLLHEFIRQGMTDPPLTLIRLRDAHRQMREQREATTA